MRDYFVPETPITDAIAVTNADRIRAMSDEELAMFLADEIPHGDCCDCNLECATFEGDKFGDSCHNAFYRLLKQPAYEPPKEEAQQDCTYNKNGHCMGQKLMPECDAKNCDRRK